MANDREGRDYIMTEIDVMTIIEDYSKEVFAFISEMLCKNDYTDIKEGRIDFTDGSYANIACYQTNGRFEKKYESHSKYIDIHMLLIGQEIIEIASERNLEKYIEYNSKSDVAFFYNDYKGKQVMLHSKKLQIIYPQQGHISGISVMSPEIVKKIVFKIPIEKKKKLFIMDVDGTLTDGKIYISEKGELYKVFDIQDGFGIKSILPLKNYVPIVITGRNSSIVDIRCRELGIQQVFQGVKDKVFLLERIASCYGLCKNKKGIYEDIAYIGDDVLDIDCMRTVQYSGAPANSAENVKKVATYVCHQRGGDGAVREFMEWLLNDL